MTSNLPPKGVNQRGHEKNAMEMSMTFANMEQAASEDCATATNLKMENSTLTEQLEMYSNRLYIKEEDNVVLQTAN